ncbi:DUF4864 domain-containing protein [Patescibacteria group bacterium]|nr:DUF4864 domain-containing protein [Patescibacteria group bacterium]MBU1705664.1 DUF4864 domain-containing protein [Patescibacteria group bacterium]
MDDYGPPDMELNADSGEHSPGKATKSGSIKIAVGLLIGFIIFGIGVFALVMQLTNGPREVADVFMADLNAGQVASAYDLTSSAFQEAVSGESWAQFVEAYPILVGYQDVSFNYSSMAGDSAVISGTLKGTDGEVRPVTIDLVKENEEWRVLNLSLEPEDAPQIEAEF